MRKELVHTQWIAIIGKADKYTNFMFYIHGYMCELTKNIKDDVWLGGRQKHLARTQSTTQYEESKGFHVVEMWECEFNRLC